MFLKQPIESSGSRRSSGSEFQIAGDAWKKPRGSIVLVFVCGRWEDAPGTGLNAGRSEWTILAPGRTNRRGTGGPTRGGTWRQEGRSWTSPDWECQASVAVGAWGRWRKTDTAVEVRASPQRAEPIEVYQSGTSGTRPADRCNNRHARE